MSDTVILRRLLLHKTVRNCFPVLTFPLHCCSAGKALRKNCRLQIVCAAFK